MVNMMDMDDKTGQMLKEITALYMKETFLRDTVLEKEFSIMLTRLTRK